MVRDVIWRYSPEKLITLQARLNDIFVMHRDSGRGVDRVYAELKRVEHVLSVRHIFW